MQVTLVNCEVICPALSSILIFNVTSGGQGSEEIYESGVTPALRVRLTE